MTDNLDINSYLRKSECISGQNFISKEESSNKTDLYGLLELLNVTNDIDLQLKVFASLSAYLLFNKGANIDVIIKCNAVYDKIGDALSRGLARKSIEALNFLSALLYIDTDEDNPKMKVTLALYARNMTRVSGCLSKMCEMFYNCMMFHDTWKALCQCLAVACSGCKINQSYCSHLIPVCIQNCSQQNIDVLTVLQSLMLNHNRNIQLFLHYKGVLIFTRDLLHYDKCLQILVTVVQFSPSSTTLLHQTNVLEDLRDFLRLYGPNSQLGQKAIIILDYINARSKGTVAQQLACETKMCTNKSNTIDLNSTKICTNKSNTIEMNSTKSQGNNLEETKVLIQNVMKEIFKWKQNEMLNLKQTDSRSNLDGVETAPGLESFKRKQINANRENTFTRKKYNEANKPTGKRCVKQTELSFGFLENDGFKVPKQRGKAKGSTRTHNGDTQRTNIEDTRRENTFYSNMKLSEEYKDDNTITSQDFKPKFASTPKNITESLKKVTKATSMHSHKTSEAQSKQTKYKDLKRERQSAKRDLVKEKSMRNKTLGARFYSAINDSCTSLVKTFKNIFNKKISSDVSESSRSTPSENSHNKRDKRSTYSFVNYMKKRDAVLRNKWTIGNVTDRSNLTEGNSCKTCDDTLALKQKLTQDEYLKHTVKKLKLGINLYGCDFKKISKTMWPRETYMTPLVLYNLYRKLLLK